MKELNKRNKDIMFYTIFFIIFVALWFRNKYGFGNLDESFYLTIPQRLYQGDVLIYDEWHVSMLSGYLIYPIMCLYRVFFNDCEAIILNFRYIYTLILGLVTLVIYNKLKKYNFYGAVISSLIFFIYAPYNMTALSYNTMGIMFLTLACVLLTCNEENKRITNILIGTFYSFSVLCCPYLIALFLIYTLYKLFVYKKLDSEWIFIFTGIFIQFILFVIFILSRCSISDVVKSISLILSDPEYSNKNSGNFVIRFFQSISNVISFKTICMCFILFLSSLFDKNKKYIDIILLLSIITVFLMLCIDYKNNQYINMIMFPLVFLGPICSRYDSEINRRLLKYIWIPGLIYSFCINLSSDQTSFVITSAGAVSIIASIMMLCEIIKKLRSGKIKKLILISTLLLFSFQLYFELDLRWNKVYWENSLEEQNVLISNGPEKGLYVTQEKYDMYYADMKDIESCSYKGDSVLYLTHKCWYYLFNEGKYKNAAYSAWLSRNPIRLIDYYEINPKKLPDNIYAEEEYFVIVDAIIEKYSYDCEITGLGNRFCKLK